MTETASTATIYTTGRVGRSLAGYVTMPLILGTVCLALYLWISGQQLDTIEARSLNAATLGTATWRHIQLTLVSTIVTLVIAIPLGIVLTRPFAKRVRPFVVGTLTVLQAVPTIAIIVLLAVAFLFLGFWSAIVALFLYAIIPVLLNTMVGIEEVDEAVLEAGRGMGMGRWTVLRKLELPLFIPVMLAGIRTALVLNVGTATLVKYINAGGLGDIIVAGMAVNRFNVQMVGATLTAVLALSIDYIAGLVEDLLRPKGL